MTGRPSLFVAICRDVPNSMALRQHLAPKHLAYVAGLGPVVRVGGLCLGADGRTVEASLVILEAADIDSARHLIEADPFAREGVWRMVSVQPFIAGVGSWIGDDAMPPPPGLELPK